MHPIQKQSAPAAASLRLPVIRALGFAAMFALASPAWSQILFAKPEQAAEALIKAFADSDAAALQRLLGSKAAKLVPLDRIAPEDRKAFLDKAAQSQTVKVDGNRARIVVGSDPWTLPIPMVQMRDRRWRFDPVAAEKEVTERRIGANERAAMQAALAYVDAQRDYATADRDGDGVLEYAQKLLSSPGKRDGLIWSPALGDDSPLGEGFLPVRPGEGYHGYRFRILDAQGPNAKGGARSYLIGKRMTTGFALIAWPVAYGETGVMSFIVNQEGTVFERNLGSKSSEVAAGMKRFDPDASWKPATP